MFGVVVAAVVVVVVVVGGGGGGRFFIFCFFTANQMHSLDCDPSFGFSCIILLSLWSEECGSL